MRYRGRKARNLTLVVCLGALAAYAVTSTTPLETPAFVDIDIGPLGAVVFLGIIGYLSWDLFLRE